MCTFSRQYVYIWVSWLLYLNRKAKRITIAQTQVYKLDKTKRIHPLLRRVQLFYRMYKYMYKVVSVSHKTNTNTKRLINVSIKYTQLRENFIYRREDNTALYFSCFRYKQYFPCNFPFYVIKITFLLLLLDYIK